MILFFSLGAALFGKFAREKLHDFNQHGISDWKKSVIVCSGEKGMHCVYSHLNALDEKRATLTNYTMNPPREKRATLTDYKMNPPHERSDILLQTAKVSFLHSRVN